MVHHLQNAARRTLEARGPKKNMYVVKWRKLMRRVRLLSVLILLVILISACVGNTTLPDEPYSPVAYSLYPCPEDAYVGDTMPYVTEDGTL